MKHPALSGPVFDAELNSRERQGTQVPGSMLSEFIRISGVS